jgi:hypothetical protein
MQMRRGIFDTPQSDVIGYVPRHPDNEKIADSLIENELHRYP